jgi:protein-disulfide isomerase
MIHRVSISLMFALLLCNAAAQTKSSASAPHVAPSPASAAGPSNETVNNFLRHMFGWDPTIQWQITQIGMSEVGLPQAVVQVGQANGQSQTMRLLFTPDGHHAIANGDVVPFAADPFAYAREQLSKGNGIARGPANASLTIVEFSDLQCPSCKAAQPIIEKLIADNPNARFVFQNYPLPQHNWATRAALWADCAGRQNADAFWKWLPTVYAAQNEITLETVDQKLGTLLATAGGDVRLVEACVADPATKGRVDESLQLGGRLEATGTPTVFINGRKIANIGATPPEVLEKMLKYHATAQ